MQIEPTTPATNTLQVCSALRTAGEGRTAKVARTRAFQGIIDPAFTRAEHARELRAIEAISDTMDFWSVAQVWPIMTVEDRLTVVRSLLGALSEAYELSPHAVSTFSHPATVDPATGIVTALYGEVEGVALRLNVQPDAFDDFAEVVRTTIHEVVHFYQDELVAALDSGSIPEDGHRHAFVRALRLNDDAIVQPDENYDAYESQPMEQHVRSVAMRIVAALMRSSRERPTRAPSSNFGECSRYAGVNQSICSLICCGRDRLGTVSRSQCHGPRTRRPASGRGSGSELRSPQDDLPRRRRGGLWCPHRVVEKGYFQ